MSNYSKQNNIYIFLGSLIESIFFNDFKNKYFKNKINVSNSEFEKEIFKVFLDNHYKCFFISSPNVGRWPFSCKRKRFKAPKHNIKELFYCNFSTIFFLNNFSKMISIKKVLNNICKKNKGKKINIICFEMHRPYLEAAKFAKNKYNAKTLTFVPDLPEDMIWSSNIFYRFFKKIDIRKCYLLVNKYIDSLILFTNQMINKFSLKSKKFIVREGVIKTPVKKKSNCEINGTEKKNINCTFVGKTDFRNGVWLIAECAKICPHFDFHIYGSGDLDQKLKETSLNNLFFHGFIEPEKVDLVLESSDILLSPRFPNENYTLYSFPSKILKYISYNKPIITFKLPCYGNKFDDILIYPENTTVDAFKASLEKAATMRKACNQQLIEEKFSYLFPSNLLNDILNLID